MVSELEAFLVRHVEAGTVPGAVALRGGRDPEVVAAGVASADGDPMREDAIMRIQDRAFRKKAYWQAVRTTFNLDVTMVEKHREVLPDGN